MDLLKKLMKFGFPALEVIIGIYLVTFSGQGQMFIIAGLAIIASGLLTGLFIANIIGKGVNYALQIVILLIAVYFAYADFNSVDSEIRFARKKQKVESETIQHLKDIRTAELHLRKLMTVILPILIHWLIS